MKKLIAGLVLVSMSGMTEAAPKDEQIEALSKRLTESFPTVKAEDIKRTPVDGLFEVSRGLSFFYVTADGKYAFDGDMIDLAKGESLTEGSRKTLRLAALDDIGQDKMIVYPAKKEKHVLTVFTDIDCGYCRKLHRELKDYNDQGITVRYLFYPRSGPNTASWTKAENTWCAADRNKALTSAKAGEDLPKANCTNPVMEHYKAGQQLGVRGTPALVLDDGTMQPGYVPAARLAQLYAKGNP